MSNDTSSSTPSRSEKLVAFLIASVTVLAAVITFLQTYVSGKGDEANRISVQYAIQAMQVRTSGETRVSHEWQGAYQTWYELDLQAIAADLAGDSAAAARYRTVRDRIAGLSPLLSPAYFDPNANLNPNSYGYQADEYVVEATRLSEKFSAYNEIGDAWDDRSKILIVNLTILAVSLSLYGLSTTIKGFMRHAFLALGTLAAGVVVLWSGVTMLLPLPRLPEEAINAYADGMGLSWRGDYAGAIQHFDEALSLQPGYANALYERGNAYYYVGNYQAAAADYEASIRAGRTDTNVGWNLGWTYYLLGRFDDAIRVDRAALEQDPSLMGVRFNLALALMVNGQLDQARSEYQSGVDQAVGEVTAAHANGAQPPSSFWYYMDASATDIDSLLHSLDNDSRPWMEAPASGTVRADPSQVRALATEMFHLLKGTTASLEFTGQAPPQTQRGTVTAFVFGQEELDSRGNLLRYNTAVSFPNGLKGISILFDYSGMRTGASEVWKVYRNGIEDPTLRVIGTWQLGDQGSGVKTISYTYSDLVAFGPGEYTVELYIDYQLIGRGTFTVEQ